jgi:carboxyl-terminal processing protease
MLTSTEWMPPDAVIDAAFAALLDMATHGAAVFVLATIAALLLTVARASAAVRHLAWTLGVIASLALPVLSLFVPNWRLVSPGPVAHETEIAVIDTTGAIVFDESDLSPNSVQTAYAENAVSTAQDHTAMSRPTAGTPIAHTSATAPAQWRGWVLAGWLLGALAALLPALFGLVSLGRLRRDCQPITHGRCFQVLSDLLNRLAIRRPVQLLSTSRRHMPMTWGIRWPVLLLPADANNWPNERLQAVLLHELAHVQRFDCLTQIAAQLARALYWYNPLAWLAVHRMRRDQEQACDDRVLAADVDAADYAEQLFIVASRAPARAVAAAVALAMARSSRIKSRIVAILDPRRNRRSLSRRRTASAILATLALAIPLAGITWQAGDPDAIAQDNIQTAPDPQSSAQDAQRLADRLAKIRQTLLEQHVAPPNEEAIARGAIAGMVQALVDPHSGFIPAEKLTELETQIRGKLIGIGARLDIKDSLPIVVEPLPGSPALAAGIKLGDVILEIDGQPARGLPLSEVVKRIQGPSATKVTLKIRRAAGDETTIDVVRRPIVLSTITGFDRDEDQRWRHLIDAEHKIGYIAVEQFGPRTAAELSEAIRNLQKAGLKGLILDLRFCPGGLLQAAFDSAQLFLSDATVVTVRGRDGNRQVWKTGKRHHVGDVPLVVLIGDQTASAAEVLAGALADNDRAILVGERTFGKGTIQSLIMLEDTASRRGGAIRLTTAYNDLPSGRNIERKSGETTWGVDPTDGYFVPLTPDERESRERRAKNKSDRTPKASRKEGSRQLAAARRAMIARITTGEFEKTGQSAEAARSHATRHAELARRREAILKNIQELNEELKSLE